MTTLDTPTVTAIIQALVEHAKVYAAVGDMNNATGIADLIASIREASTVDPLIQADNLLTVAADRMVRAPDSTSRQAEALFMVRSKLRAVMVSLGLPVVDRTDSGPTPVLPSVLAGDTRANINDYYTDIEGDDGD